MALGTMGAAQAQITVPQRRTGLLAWDVVKDGPDHWQAGVQWDSAKTGVAQVRSDLADVTSKTFGVVATGQGPSFYVYVGVDSQMIGGQDAKQVARERLEAVETAAVEQAIRDIILIPQATLLDVAKQRQVTALGLVEHYMAENYGGLPMIYASPHDVLIGIERNVIMGSEDGRCYTGVGTPVAAGSGFLAGDGSTVDGTTALAGEFFVFASGYPTLYRSAINVSEAIATSTNKQVVLAERIYTAALDGPIVAALADRT